MVADQRGGAHSGIKLHCISSKKSEKRGGASHHFQSSNNFPGLGVLISPAGRGCTRGQPGTCGTKTGTVPADYLLGAGSHLPTGEKRATFPRRNSPSVGNFPAQHRSRTSRLLYLRSTSLEGGERESCSRCGGWSNKGSAVKLEEPTLSLSSPAVSWRLHHLHGRSAAAWISFRGPGQVYLVQTPRQPGNRRRREIDALVRRGAPPILQFCESLLPLSEGGGLARAEVGFAEVTCLVFVASSEPRSSTPRSPEKIRIVEEPWRCVWGYGYSCWRCTSKVSRRNETSAGNRARHVCLISPSPPPAARGARAAWCFAGLNSCMDGWIDGIACVCALQQGVQMRENWKVFVGLRIQASPPTAAEYLSCCRMMNLLGQQADGDMREPCRPALCKFSNISL